MKGFHTIQNESEIEYIVQKSRFIGRCFPIESEQEAQQILERIRKQHWDATHNCYAYSLGDNAQIARYSDDGEPSGTAGLPMIEVLKKNHVTNLLCVVTRYFGGILLGAGGLVRAYTKSTVDALKAAGCVEMRPCMMLDLVVPYPLWGKVEPLCREMAAVEAIDFLEVVKVTVAIPWDEKERFIQNLIDRTDGKIIPQEGKKVLRAFHIVPENEKE